MKYLNRMVAPVLALAALTAACSNDDDGIGITTTTTANIRFINAVNGSSNLALTSNGSMVGSGQSFFNGATPTCTTVNTASSGNAFAFGTANTGGTGISGTAFSSFNQTLQSGGNYTVIATGTSTSPGYIFLDNSSATTAGTGFANVRFVNATGQSNLSLSGFATNGTTLTGQTATATGLNSTNTFSGYTQVPIANTTFTFMNGTSTTPVKQTTFTTLTSGGNYTVVLLPGATAGTYQTLVYNSAC